MYLSVHLKLAQIILVKKHFANNNFNELLLKKYFWFERIITTEEGGESISSPVPSKRVNGPSPNKQKMRNIIQLHDQCDRLHKYISNKDYNIKYLLNHRF